MRWLRGPARAEAQYLKDIADPCMEDPEKCKAMLKRMYCPGWGANPWNFEGESRHRRNAPKTSQCFRVGQEDNLHFEAPLRDKERGCIQSRADSKNWTHVHAQVCAHLDGKAQAQTWTKYCSRGNYGGVTVPEVITETVTVPEATMEVVAAPEAYTEAVATPEATIETVAVPEATMEADALTKLVLCRRML